MTLDDVERPKRPSRRNKIVLRSRLFVTKNAPQCTPTPSNKRPRPICYTN